MKRILWLVLCLIAVPAFASELSDALKKGQTTINEAKQKALENLAYMAASYRYCQRVTFNTEAIADYIKDNGIDYDDVSDEKSTSNDRKTFEKEEEKAEATWDNVAPSQHCRPVLEFFGSNGTRVKDWVKEKPEPDWRYEKWDVVSAQDLQVTPGKYLRKHVYVKNVSCIYAGISDYRCVTSGAAMAIFAKDFYLSEAKDYITRECASVNDAGKKKCTFNIYLVFKNYDRDKADFAINRTVIHADFIAVANMHRE